VVGPLEARSQVKQGAGPLAPLLDLAARLLAGLVGLVPLGDRGGDVVPGHTAAVAALTVDAERLADGAAPSRIRRDLFVAGVSGVIALVTALVVALMSVLGANSIRPSVRAWKRAAKHKQMKSGSHARQKCAARMLRYTKSFGGCTRLAWHHRVHL
jgi:hypothetical protein